MALDLYDSVNWGAIPADATMVAGYGNGWYVWPQAAWDRFAQAKCKLVISVSAFANIGHVLDCETGDATPAQCPGWVRMRQASGLVKPCIYCNLSTMSAVQAACAGLNYSLWIAWYTGNSSSVVTGAAAVQYADPAAGSGGDWDATCIADPAWPYDIWGAASNDAPVPSPATLPGPVPISKERAMRFVIEGTQQHIGGVDSSGVLRHWWNDISAGVAWNSNDPKNTTGRTIGLEAYAPCDMVVVPNPTNPATPQIHLTTPTIQGGVLHAYQTLGDPTWSVEAL